MPTDLEKLQGTWTVTSLENDGQSVTPAAFNGAHFTIKGKRFTSVGMGAAYEGTIALNQTKKPKTFELLFSAGPEKGNRNLGIYKLDADRWTICLATRGSKRPSAFATKPGTGFALETLERGSRKASKGKGQSPKAGTADPSKAAAAIPARAASGAGPASELEGEWAMVSAVFDGKPMDEQMVQWCKRVTDGDVTSVIAGPQVMLKARFTLDRSATPHGIDYVNLAGPNARKTQAGIFELSAGTLRICMAAPGDPRPKDFSSKRGDQRSFTTWQKTS